MIPNRLYQHGSSLTLYPNPMHMHKRFTQFALTFKAPSKILRYCSFPCEVLQLCCKQINSKTLGVRFLFKQQFLPCIGRVTMG
jgi:hypothetical protein